MSTDSVLHDNTKSTSLPADVTDDSCTSVLLCTTQAKVIYLVLLVVLHL